MPFSFLQVLAFILALYLICSFTTTETALLIAGESNTAGLVISAALYLISFIAMVIQTVLVTGTDPSDPIVNLSRLNKKTFAQFNEGKVDKFVYFRERDYDYFCTVCDSFVLSDSKHCM